MKGSTQRHPFPYALKRYGSGQVHGRAGIVGVAPAGKPSKDGGSDLPGDGHLTIDIFYQRHPYP